MRAWSRIAPAVLLAITLCCGVQACGNSSDDGVDVAALDTGDWSTTPQNLGTATSDNIIDFEAQRLADYVVGPFEIDPVLQGNTKPTWPIRYPTELNTTINRASTTLAPDTFIYGFVSSFQEPVTPATVPHKSLQIAVLRFVSAATAADAARRFDTSARSGDDLITPATTTTVPGTPANTLASTATRGDATHHLSTFTAHGVFVIYVRADAPTADHTSWLTTTVAAAISKELPVIDTFHPRPTKEERHDADLAMPQLDPHKILLYTIPVPARDAAGKENGGYNAVYGIRGMSHFQDFPTTSREALTAAGSTISARGSTSVYRADTPQKATTLRDAFVAQQTRSDSFTAMSGPPGLPSAVCISKDTFDGRVMACYVVVGRYVGELSQLDDEKALWQETSAQYVILTKANQNAH